MNSPITFDIKNRIFIYNNTYLSDHMPIFCIHNQLKIMSWNINYEDQSVIDLVTPAEGYWSQEGKNTEEFLDHIYKNKVMDINIPPRSLNRNSSKLQRNLDDRSIKDIRYYTHIDPSKQDTVFTNLLIDQSNIYGCNKRIAACIFLNDTINENNLDIICLQECTSNMHDILRFYFMKEWNIHSYKQFIIMVKRTITSTILPSINEKYLAMDIKYNHLKFKLVNIHITKVTDPRTKATDDRVIEIRQIYNDPFYSDVLICGDFNSEKPTDFNTINCGNIFGPLMSDIKCYFLYKKISPTVLNHTFINHRSFNSIIEYIEYIRLHPVISPSSTSGHPSAPPPGYPSASSFTPPPGYPSASSSSSSSGYTSALSSAPPPARKWIIPRHRVPGVPVLPGGYYQKYIELKNEYKEAKNKFYFI